MTGFPNAMPISTSNAQPLNICKRSHFALETPPQIFKSQWLLKLPVKTTLGQELARSPSSSESPGAARAND